MRFYTKWAEKVAVTTLHVGPFLLFRVKIRIITEDVRFTNKEMVNDVNQDRGLQIKVAKETKFNLVFEGRNMADRLGENGPTDSEGKGDERRPVSGRSKGSADSKKSIQDAVSKLTVNALKEFRLSDPSDVDTVVTGAESEGLVPTATLTQDIPTFDPRGALGAQTLLSEDITGSGEEARDDEIEGDIGEDGDEGLSDEEESGSDGESDMVVLDPDHVSQYCLLKAKCDTHSL